MVLQDKNSEFYVNYQIQLIFHKQNIPHIGALIEVKGPKHIICGQKENRFIHLSLIQDIQMEMKYIR